MLDEWLGDLRAVRGLRRSTLRGYQEAIRMLCQYLTDPAYGWTGECETRFGTHPVQVVHEWNTAVHVQQAEGDPIKRAFTIDELQAFFDHADGEGRPDPRRRPEGVASGVPRCHLVQDRLRVRVAAQRNPHARYRRLRHQPARTRVRRARGLLRPPRQSHEGLRPETAKRAHRLAVGRRSSHRVDHPDSAAARRQQQPGQHGVVALRAGHHGSGWPRSTPASLPSAPGLGLGPGLDFHSLRRSYVTHLIEAGWDPLFVQSFS